MKCLMKSTYQVKKGLWWAKPSSLAAQNIRRIQMRQSSTLNLLPLFRGSLFSEYHALLCETCLHTKQTTRHFKIHPSIHTYPSLPTVNKPLSRMLGWTEKHLKVPEPKPSRVRPWVPFPSHFLDYPVSKPFPCQQNRTTQRNTTTEVNIHDDNTRRSLRETGRY